MSNSKPIHEKWYDVIVSFKKKLDFVASYFCAMANIW
jgi:hypothetical protein